MGRIVKVKNIYEFWLDGKTKPYKLDINSGVLYGLRGSALKSTPADFNSLMSRYRTTDPLIALMYERSNAWCDAIRPYQWAEHSTTLQLADKLTAIKYDYNNDSDLRTLGSDEMVSYLAKNFKALAKYLVENAECGLREFVSVYGKNMWLAEHKLTPTEQLTEEMIEWLYANRNHFTDTQIPLCAYFLSRGLWEFYDGGYDLRVKLADLFEKARFCGYEVEKSDFFRQYINISRDYKRIKNQQSKELFEKAYAKQSKVLQYENDNFVVVLPTCENDLITEGNKQSNCVGGYGKQITEGYKLVVFIRKKSNPTAPYITCDIYTGHRGSENYWWSGKQAKINQYLIANNCSPTDPSALDFYTEYQQYLYDNWNMGE